MLELWFDFSCPYAYLASRRAPALAAELGVEIDWRPMLLGGVFRGIGAGDGPMATLSPQKARHNLTDMHRWAEQFGEPFAMPAGHPMRTVRALRVLLALPRREWASAIAGIYAAYWQRGEDITDDTVIAAALRRTGVPGDDIASALRDGEFKKDELRARTDEAISLGIFGAPAWVVRGPFGGYGGPRPALVWGQDRLDWLRAMARGWDLASPPPWTPPRTVGDAPVEVFFDVASPFSYFALTQVDAGARLRPILLGALFRDIGQADVPLFAMPAAKQRYVRDEMTRWAAWWNIPFDMPRKFPQRTVTAQRLCVLAREHGADLALARALGRAMWAEQKDLEDPQALRAILASCGLPEAWLERASDAKQALIDETAAAKAAGAFGVPTFVVDGQLFWGQDRLALVDRARAGWRPVHG